MTRFVLSALVALFASVGIASAQTVDLNTLTPNLTFPKPAAQPVAKPVQRDTVEVKN